MSELFIKGTVIGLDYKKWKEDIELFSSILSSVLETWKIRTYDNQDNLKTEIAENLSREYGRVKSAYYGFDGDVNNLSVNYHLLKSILENKDLENGLKTMYLSLLVENYIINIRSIYDFTSFFPRLIMPLKDIQQYKNRKNPDSLNTFITYCEKNKPSFFSQDFLNLMNGTKEDLEVIRKIRDSIIHKGKESLIIITDNDVLFRIPSKAPYGVENSLPDILDLGNSNYPLLIYLRKLTVNLINYMEQLGNLMFLEFKKDENYRLELTALIGICIKDFNEFIHEK
jgi:hypothetical protein